MAGRAVASAAASAARSGGGGVSPYVFREPRALARNRAAEKRELDTEEAFDRAQDISVLERATYMSKGIRRGYIEDSRREHKVAPGISVIQVSEDSMAGRTVIKPPLSVMPPKASLGYYGANRSSAKDIALWYHVRMSEKREKRVSKDHWLGRRADTTRGLRDLLEWEAENGLLATMHPARLRWQGEVEYYGGDCQANEVAPSGDVYLNVPPPKVAVPRRRWAEALADEAAAAAATGAAPPAPPPRKTTKTKRAAGLDGGDDDGLAVWASHDTKHANATQQGAAAGDSAQTEADAPAHPSTDKPAALAEEPRVRYVYKLPDGVRDFLWATGDAAEANITARPYLQLHVSKQAITHERLVQWLCRKLELPPERFGIREIADASHYMTQAVFLRTADAMPRAQGLESLLGSWDVDGGRVEVHFGALLERLPRYREAKVATWTTVRGIPLIPDRLSVDLNYWLDRKGVFANLFPPAAFNSHRCRPVPLWAVGWHLYRMDDLHIAYSVLAHEIYSRFGAHYSVMLVPFDEWHRHSAISAFVDALTTAKRASKGNAQHAHVDGLVRYIIKHKSAKGVAQWLLHNHMLYVGECLGAFHKFCWNMVVSGRLKYSPRPMSNDLVVDPAFPDDPWLSNHEALMREKLYGSRDRHLKEREHNPARDEEYCLNAVFPFAHLFSDAPPSDAQKWPAHMFSQTMVKKLLMTLGLTYEDMRRLSSYLPLSITSQPYRPMVATVHNVDYAIRNVAMPAQLDDAAAAARVAPNGEKVKLTGCAELASFRVPPEEEVDSRAAGYQAYQEMVNARKERAREQLDRACEATIAVTCDPDASSYCALREVLMLRVYDAPDKQEVPLAPREMRRFIKGRQGARRRGGPRMQSLSSPWARKVLKTTGVLDDDEP